MTHVIPFALTIVAVLAVGCSTQNPARKRAFTTGNVLKSGTTEIVDVGQMALVNPASPAVNFKGDIGKGKLGFSTNGESVWLQTSHGSPITRPNCYVFSLGEDGLMARRSADVPQATAPIDLYGATAEHTATAFAPREVYDLRPDQTKLEGWLVVAVTTTSPTDTRPKKKLYQVDIKQLEEKLPPP